RLTGVRPRPDPTLAHVAQVEDLAVADQGHPPQFGVFRAAQAGVGLDNGLGNLIKYQEIRSNKDLANIASSPEFEALLLEFEKPAPVQTGKKK
ncbi:MAG: hypothetical protein MUP19_00230, partial [Candidatus Aminicenantes bacterium]|nr:hypothetical protein [Candidatus Aminicenantes bacterium]